MFVIPPHPHARAERRRASCLAAPAADLPSLRGFRPSCARILHNAQAAARDIQ